MAAAVVVVVISFGFNNKGISWNSHVPNKFSDKTLYDQL
jgi:hypothetical protein